MGAVEPLWRVSGISALKGRDTDVRGDVRVLLCLVGLSGHLAVLGHGELQGGIASLLSVAMLLGTLFFSQVFGYFMREDAPFQSPDVAYFIAAAVVAASLAAFVWLVKPEGKKA